MRTLNRFLRECVQLLYWVFFKPTALRAHINHIAPGYEARLLNAAERTRWGRASVSLRELRENLALRAFVWKALVTLIVAPFLLYGAIGLTITAFGGHFNWQRSWDDVAVGVATGVAFGVTRCVALGVALGVAFGVVVSVAAGVAVGVAVGVEGGVAFGVVAGVAIGVGAGVGAGVITGVEGGVAFGVVVSVAAGVAFGVATGIMGGLAFGFARAVTFGVATGITLGVAYMRFPVYLFEIVPAILAFRRSVRNHQFERELRRSPIHFDELSAFPQPYLSSLLFNLLQQDLQAGLAHTSRVANHPNQNWAAQKALKKLLATDRAPFFSSSTGFSARLSHMSR